MNPPRPELPEDQERRLLDELLGELPPAEATSLKEQLATDPALHRRRDELARLIDLLREAWAPEVRLSPERRKRILATSPAKPWRRLTITLSWRRLLRSWASPVALAASLVLLLSLLLRSSLAERQLQYTAPPSSPFRHTDSRETTKAKAMQPGTEAPGEASPPSAGRAPVGVSSTARSVRVEGAGLDEISPRTDLAAGPSKPSPTPPVAFFFHQEPPQPETSAGIAGTSPAEKGGSLDATTSGGCGGLGGGGFALHEASQVTEATPGDRRLLERRKELLGQPVAATRLAAPPSPASPPPEDKQAAERYGSPSQREQIDTRTAETLAWSAKQPAPEAELPVRDAGAPPAGKGGSGPRAAIMAAEGRLAGSRVAPLPQLARDQEAASADRLGELADRQAAAAKETESRGLELRRRSGTKPPNAEAAAERKAGTRYGLLPEPNTEPSPAASPRQDHSVTRRGELHTAAQQLKLPAPPSRGAPAGPNLQDLSRKPAKAEEPDRTAEVAPPAVGGEQARQSKSGVERLARRLQPLQEQKAAADGRHQWKADFSPAPISRSAPEAAATLPAKSRPVASNLAQPTVDESLAESAEKDIGFPRPLAPTEPNVTTATAIPRPPPASAPGPEVLPEVATAENAFSTFSLNVSDVSFKLAEAALAQGRWPEPRSVRSEEFVNAFDYRDPEPPRGQRVGLIWERGRYPFAHNRDVIRFSIKTAASGREAGRPLNLVVLLDSSGSMERADRVRILREALNVLGEQLRPGDRLSIVTFASSAHLLADGLQDQAAREALARASEVPPQGGTNLEDALRLAYQTARRHFLSGGINRVVLLTDGAANLGNVDPKTLQQMVIEHRQRGVALDAFGVGWEGYNDELLETLTRHGDGRYGFLNTPEDAGEGFARQLAGALQVAAADVKVQVEFNPGRVVTWRQVGFEKHRLRKEQFRDNKIDAAEIGAAEAGNALYIIQPNPEGHGPIGYLRVRYRIPETGRYEEREWVLHWTGPALRLEQASPSLRLATVAAAFAEWLVRSPYAAEVTPDRLLELLRGVPEHFAPDPRLTALEQMIQQARRLAGSR